MYLPSPLEWAPALLLGLCFGSFLNVVITRLPVMLMRRWRNEALASLEFPAETAPRFNLATPGSMCRAASIRLRGMITYRCLAG